MSSLTSLGVNKNTTRFAPKPRRSRRVRKPKITPPLSDSEDDIKYPIIVDDGRLPHKVPCAYMKKPPTPPFVPSSSSHHKKIPTIIAADDDSASLPASPPDDTPILLEEEFSLEELKRFAQERRRSRQKEKRSRRTSLKKTNKEKLQTLDEINYEPPTTVDPESIMSEHTRDGHFGVVSKAFKQVEIARLDKARKERDNKKKDEIINIENPYRKANSPIYRKDADALIESSSAPQVRLVDGEIVLDVDSLVRRPAQVDERQQGELEVVEENEYSRRVNAGTYSTRCQSARWSELETVDFYNAIAQFGTDFEMISSIMPGRTRQHIRNKFNKEDKVNPAKISDYLLRKRELPDLQKYSAIIGKELEEVPDEFMEDQ